MSFFAAKCLAFEDEKDAASYNSMINEDRVWEYCLSYGGPDNADVCIFQMKFDGERSVNGTTYHRFKFTGDEALWTVNMMNGQYNGDLEINSNEKTQYFLLREEDRRVYLYLDESFEDVKSYLAEVCSLNVDEILLYDFNLGEGDEMGLLSIIYHYPNPLTYAIGYNNHIIDKTDYTDIGGEACLTQLIGDKWFVMVEGIGCIGRGILPAYQIDGWLTSFSSSEYFYTLNRVYDSNGEVIYNNPDGVTDIPTSVGAVYDDTHIQLHYRNSVIEAYGICPQDCLELYDAKGQLLESANGKDHLILPTNELQPGVYVAKAGSKTLKILIK